MWFKLFRPFLLMLVLVLAVMALTPEKVSAQDWGAAADADFDAACTQASIDYDMSTQIENWNLRVIDLMVVKQDLKGAIFADLTIIYGWASYYFLWQPAFDAYQAEAIYMMTAGIGYPYVNGYVHMDITQYFCPFC